MHLTTHSSGRDPYWRERRELAGLAEAARTLGVERLLVLTFDQRASLEIAGARVRVMPVWEWLLLDGEET